MAVSYHCHPGRKLPASPGEVYSGVSFVFRLFVSTAARFRQARGAAAAAGFAAGYLRAAPWAPRWSVFLDRLCQRRFGTAAPLNLILGGLGRPGGISHSRQVSRLRAHCDIIDSYFTDTVAARMIFERDLPMAVAAGEGAGEGANGGARVYRLEVATPGPQRRADGELMLALSHADGQAAALPFRFGYCGGNRIALRLGRMQLAAQVETVEADLYGLPVRAALMDGVYAIVRTLGVTELTAELDDNAPFWTDCGGVYSPGGRFELPLDMQFWHSDAGRTALGEAWVPQQMLRADIMSQANAAATSWLRYDEGLASRTERRVTVAAAK